MLAETHVSQLQYEKEQWQIEIEGDSLLSVLYKGELFYTYMFRSFRCKPGRGRFSLITITNPFENCMWAPVFVSKMLFGINRFRGGY